MRDSVVSRPDLDTESLYDKQWHHLAVVWNGTTRTLYLDGVLQSAATAAAAYRTPSGTVRFGARDDGNKDCVWTGDLDEVRFLPSAASADDRDRAAVRVGIGVEVAVADAGGVFAADGGDNGALPGLQIS